MSGIPHVKANSEHLQIPRPFWTEGPLWDTHGLPFGRETAAQAQITAWMKKEEKNERKFAANTHCPIVEATSSFAPSAYTTQSRKWRLHTSHLNSREKLLVVNAISTI